MGKLLRDAQFGRRPISSRRRWLGLAGLVLLLGLIGAYHYLTRPQRIRAFAEAYLQEITGGIVRIQTARFNLFEGLHLANVRVATQPDASFNAPHNSFDDRTIFTSQDLYLKLRPLSLITGDLVVPEITAFEPMLRLLRDPESGARNWEFLLGQRKRARRPTAKSPTIRLRGAVVDLLWTRSSPGRAPSHLALDVTATSASGSLYDVRWRTRSEPIENGRFMLDMSTLQLRTAEGGLPTIPVASIRWAAPLELERWIDLLDLRGQVRTDSLAYDPAAGSSAQITLHNASIAVPVSEQDRAVPREQRYLTFTHVEGKLIFHGSAVDISLVGQWRDGTCTLNGRIFANVATMRSLDDIGFEIAIEGRHIRLPALPGTQSPEEARFIQQWPKFVDFCDFYSPVGHVDLAFKLARKAGRGAPLEFGGGTLTALGARAAFIGFPYLLEDLRGTIRFEPDGHVRIDNLVGRHGTATVAVNARMTSPTWACGVDLSVEAFRVELDESLRSCLPETYRAVWDMLHPVGFVNVRAAMHREPGTGKNTKPWDTHVSTDLLGISACYADLPLTMSSVCGQLQITPDEFFVQDVQGRYRSAVWSLAGVVATPPGRPPQVDLAVRAKDLPVDSALAGAIPEPGSNLLRTLDVAGAADIDGTVRTGEDGTFEYDLGTLLTLSSLCPGFVPLQLTDVRAALRILPQQIEVQDLAACYESGLIGLRGAIPLAADAGAMRVNVTGYRIPLTPALFETLPLEAQRVWTALRPQGQIDAHVRIRRTGNGTRAITDAQAEISPQNLTISPLAFPIRIADIRGMVRATGRCVEMSAIEGTIGDGRVSLDGRVDWQGDDLAGELCMRATDMTFGEAIRRALPWRARRAWDGVQPAGTFDLSLGRLSFEQKAGNPTRWNFDGRLDLRKVDLTAAGTLRDIEGAIDAHGTTAGGSPGIEGNIDLRRIRFGQRVATNVRGTLAKPPGEAVLHLADLRADLYDGLATGFAELRFGRDRTTYGLSVVARGVSLPAFLEAGREEDARAVQAQGVIDGMLFVNGSLGTREPREGGGTIRIERAQIMKIPLLLAIVGALNLAPPDENAFHEGIADFTLQGDSLTLRPIELRGNAVSLVGAGRMNMATQAIDLRLLAGGPHRLPPLGVLTELAEGAARELMEVRVRGSLYEPKIEAQPLQSLHRALDAIGDLQPRARKNRLSRP